MEFCWSCFQCLPLILYDVYAAILQSAATSFVSGSSVWTDTSGADRGSRRALILQMAKARMKGNQRAQSEAPIEEEQSIDETSEQESKTTAPTKVSDIELAGELD